MMDSLKDDTSQDVTPVFQLVRSQLTSSNASTHSGCRSVSSLGQCPTYISLSDLPSNDLTLNLQLNKNDEIKEFVQSNWEYFYKYKVKKWQLDCYRQRHLQKSPSSSIHNISQSDDDSQSGISRFSSGRNIEEAGGTYLSTAVISDQQDDGFKRPHSVLSKSAIKSYKALETYKQTTLIFKSWTLKLTPQLKLCLRGLMEGINHPVQSDPVVCRLSCWTVASKDSVYVLNTRPETSGLPPYVVNQFCEGFPKDWDVVLNQWIQFVQQGQPEDFNWLNKSYKDITAATWPKLRGNSRTLNSCSRNKKTKHTSVFETSTPNISDSSNFTNDIQSVLDTPRTKTGFCNLSRRTILPTLSQLVTVGQEHSPQSTRQDDQSNIRSFSQPSLCSKTNSGQLAPHLSLSPINSLDHYLYQSSPQNLQQEQSQSKSGKVPSPAVHNSEGSIHENSLIVSEPEDDFHMPHSSFNQHSTMKKSYMQTPSSEIHKPEESCSQEMSNLLSPNQNHERYTNRQQSIVMSSRNQPFSNTKSNYQERRQSIIIKNPFVQLHSLPEIIQCKITEDKPELILEKWTPILIRKPTLELVFNGTLHRSKDMLMAECHRTSPVKDILDRYLVLTSDGNLYRLVGPPVNVNNSVPKSVMTQFNRGSVSWGLPRLWHKMLKQWNNILSKKDMQTSLEDLKSKCLVDKLCNPSRNKTVTIIETTTKERVIPVSRRGRIIVPPLRYWLGERMRTINRKSLYEFGTQEDTMEKPMTPTLMQNAEMKLDNMALSHKTMDSHSFEKANGRKVSSSTRKGVSVKTRNRASIVANIKSKHTYNNNNNNNNNNNITSKVFKLGKRPLQLEEKVGHREMSSGASISLALQGIGEKHKAEWQCTSPSPSLQGRTSEKSSTVTQTCKEKHKKESHPTRLSQTPPSKKREWSTAMVERSTDNHKVQSQGASSSVDMYRKCPMVLRSKVRPDVQSTNVLSPPAHKGESNYDREKHSEKSQDPSPSSFHRICSKRSNQNTLSDRNKLKKQTLSSSSPVLHKSYVVSQGGRDKHMQQAPNLSTPLTCRSSKGSTTVAQKDSKKYTEESQDSSPSATPHRKLNQEGREKHSEESKGLSPLATHSRKLNQVSRKKHSEESEDLSPLATRSRKLNQQDREKHSDESQDSSPSPTRLRKCGSVNQRSRKKKQKEKVKSALCRKRAKQSSSVSPGVQAKYIQPPTSSLSQTEAGSQGPISSKKRTVRQLEKLTCKRPHNETDHKSVTQVSQNEVFNYLQIGKPKTLKQRKNQIRALVQLQSETNDDANDIFSDPAYQHLKCMPSDSVLKKNDWSEEVKAALKSTKCSSILSNQATPPSKYLLAEYGLSPVTPEKSKSPALEIPIYRRDDVTAHIHRVLKATKKRQTSQEKPSSNSASVVSSQNPLVNDVIDALVCNKPMTRTAFDVEFRVISEDETSFDNTIYSDI